jgi:hypothetical protein
MHINNPSHSLKNKEICKKNCIKLKESLGCRPCSNCSLICKSCKSVKCLCLCSPTCRYAAKALSSDPDNYPIESEILPLVYALSETPVFETCWSCEGHETQNKKLIRAPQVWFYAEHSDVPILLCKAVDNMYINKKIINNWDISFISNQGSGFYCYAIKPGFCYKKPVLLELQNDARSIATYLKAYLNIEVQRVQL